MYPYFWCQLSVRGSAHIQTAGFPLRSTYIPEGLTAGCCLRLDRRVPKPSKVLLAWYLLFCCGASLRLAAVTPLNPFAERFSATRFGLYFGSEGMW